MITPETISPLIKHWHAHLNTEFKQRYFNDLLKYLNSEISANKLILPPQQQWFNALSSTAPQQVKVVILGQDPYPTLGHAHGLCFSVLSDVTPLPKSLKNIYKELNNDLGIINEHGNLQSWANQGVLMLNSVLTVESGLANAHQGKGWEKFTDKIINVVNDFEQPIVFVLWGAYAQKKTVMINETKHLIIRSPHPSPLSAYRGFFGSQPFSKINAFLKQHDLTEINWHV